MPEAREGLVTVPPGDVNRICPGCGTGQAFGHDGDPRHIVLGARVERQEAVLPDGSRAPVTVPVDVAYHFDCHAAVGCDHCQEHLDAHGGSVKGKAHPEKGLPKTPQHLVELEPFEFALPDDRGAMRRIRTREEAKAHRLAEHNDPSLEVAEG